MNGEDQGITTREAVVQPEAGKEYSIRLEYFANVHPVDISFAWRGRQDPL